MEQKKSMDLRQSPMYKVILAQYGNNIKMLVDYAKKIQDKNKRNAAAYQIIEAMKIINQDIQKVDNYEKILWNHLAVISNYELDVDYPYEILSWEEFDKKPDPVDYPDYNIRIRHYGKIVEMMIEKALEIKDESVKRKYIEMILIQMKKSYLFHAHAGTYAKDELIIRDFVTLSGGKLRVPDNISLPHSRELLDRFKNIPELDNEKRHKHRYSNQKKK